MGTAVTLLPVSTHTFVPRVKQALSEGGGLSRTAVTRRRIKSKRGLYFGLLALGILGIGALNFADLIGMPWFWILAALVLLVFALFHETTYEIWRERESLGERGSGLRVSGTGMEVHSHKTPGRISIDTSISDGEAQSIFTSKDDPMPKAIRLLAPHETDYIRPEDLPHRVRWRERLRGYSIEIVSLIPGGIVLDGTNGPPQAPLKILIYFDLPSSSQESPR